MCRFAAKIPEKGEEGPWNWCGYVRGSISEADRKNLGLRRCSQERRAEGENSTPVTCSAFREDGHNPIRVF